MSRLEPLAGVRRRGGQSNHPLGDPPSGIGDDLSGQMGELGVGASRPDYQAMAAGTVDRLQYQLVQVLQRKAALVGILEQDVSTLGSNGTSPR